VDRVDALLEALDAQWQLARLLETDDLSQPSRCPGWSVRDVLAHSVGVTVKFTAFASGATDRPVTPKGDLLGANPPAVVEEAVAAARSAWMGIDRSRICHLPFGDLDATRAAGVNLFDVLAHGWDIGQVRGFRYHCDEEVWRAGLDSARDLLYPWRDPAHYGPELDPGPWASAEVRLLAFAGRPVRLHRQ
jgi:uncharacterized protein (TIGR03086 family)